MELHFIDQVADLPGAVLVTLPLISRVCHLRRSHVLYRFLQKKGLRPMLIPGGNGLLHLLKDFLFLRLAFLQLLFQVLDRDIQERLEVSPVAPVVDLPSDLQVRALPEIAFTGADLIKRFFRHTAHSPPYLTGPLGGARSFFGVQPF